MLSPSRPFFPAPRSFDFIQSLTRKSYEGLVQIAALNVQIAQTTLAEQTQHWQSLLKVQRLEELTSLQAAAVQPITSQADSYGRELYQIADGMGREWKTQLGEAQTHWDRLQGNVGSVLKNIPVTAQVLSARVKNNLASAHESVGALQKLAQQASDAAQANLLVTVQSAAQSTAPDTD